MYVQPDVMSLQVGGHLWWRKWSPEREFVILYLETPDFRDTDTWILPDDLAAELDDWDEGRFEWGETFRLTWMDDAAAEAMRQRWGLLG